MANRYGPRPKELIDLRVNRVVVCMTAAELKGLDSRRGGQSRSERLRLAEASAKPLPPPPVVPEVNRDVWGQLALGPMSNLHQLMSKVNELDYLQPGEGLNHLAGQIKQVIDIAHDFRDGLLGAREGRF